MIPDRDLLLDASADNENAVDKPEEACGVFGIYAPGQDVAKLTYFGLYALQHRGQESAGIATFDGRELAEHRDLGEETSGGLRARRCLRSDGAMRAMRRERVDQRPFGLARVMQHAASRLSQ